MQLQSFYAPPGQIFLATDSRPLGCIALRPMEPGIGELRRLYVTPDARTSGLGRRLTEHVLTHAHNNRMTRVVLNTLPTMTNAIALYESLGFTAIDPYVTDPTVGVLYFGLDLTPDL